MLLLPPLSLYIHIPWCVRKCPYCDFNSHEYQGDIPEQAYLQALKMDLANDLELVQNRKLESIFFGGGTPSLVSPAFIGEILSAAEKTIGFSPDIEITLEANPGTFEQERFRGFRAAGVNRLSLGIQSFHNDHLKALGRIHDRASAVTAAASARAAGFDNFNLDLMHGLPNQTVAQALVDIETAIALDPTHLSWYQLTIEPNTKFHKAPPTLPDEDFLSDIQDQGHHLLTQNGYHQYEVSAYARNLQTSKHNLNYWQFADYLGIGAGAHSKTTLVDTGEIIRQSKTRTPTDYLSRQSEFIASRVIIEQSELPLEFFMNALRLVEGVPAHLFTARTGLPWNVMAAQWERLQQRDLLRDASENLCTSVLGFRHLNTVLAELSA